IQHALPLSSSFLKQDNLYLAELWYFPRGVEPEPKPVVVDFQTREICYYHVPTYMATEQGDLVYQVPLRGLLAIDSWVHIFVADVIYGLVGRGAQVEERITRH